MIEIWKDIKGYEGAYKVSNLGRVKNLRRKIKNFTSPYRVIRERILKPSLDGGKYPTVMLCINNKPKRHKVHILVWEAFGNKKRNGMKLQVDHIDNVKLNNRIGNLQLLTQKENIIKYFKTRKPKELSK